jgi:hypothetical protein
VLSLESITGHPDRNFPERAGAAISRLSGIQRLPFPALSSYFIYNIFTSHAFVMRRGYTKMGLRA